MVQNHEGLQSDLRVLVEENGKALWDGVSPIDVWEATAAQNAEWEQSRDQAIRDGEIDLDAGDNPDEWNVQNFPDIASFSLQSPAASSPTDMSREEQIAAEVKRRLDAEEQQRQLALQVASMPVPSGPPRNADGGYDWHLELEQRQKQRLEESRQLQAHYERRERAEVKRWDASKGHDTNYNEYGWPMT